MSRSVPDIGSELAALEPRDFDELNPNARGIERLQELCDELLASCDVGELAPLLLGFVARLEGAYLGSPGPVVHTLEAMPGYEPYLSEAFLRRPTSLTAWMVNRIANAHHPNRAQWVQLLESVAAHPAASEVAREEICHFVRRQRGA